MIPCEVWTAKRTGHFTYCDGHHEACFRRGGVGVKMVV
jgi:hypothetical protein